MEGTLRRVEVTGTQRLDVLESPGVLNVGKVKSKPPRLFARLWLGRSTSELHGKREDVKGLSTREEGENNMLKEREGLDGSFGSVDVLLVEMDAERHRPAWSEHRRCQHPGGILRKEKGIRWLQGTEKNEMEGRDVEGTAVLSTTSCRPPRSRSVCFEVRTERRWRLSSPWGNLGGGGDDTVLKETRMEVSDMHAGLHADVEEFRVGADDTPSRPHRSSRASLDQGRGLLDLA
jgi:hypothetical protein